MQTGGLAYLDLDFLWTFVDFLYMKNGDSSLKCEIQSFDKSTTLKLTLMRNLLTTNFMTSCGNILVVWDFFIFIFFVVAIIYQHKPSLDFDLVSVVRVLTCLPKSQTKNPLWFLLPSTLLHFC